MSAYSLNHRLCFIHAPKNAGTAVRQALAQMTGDLKNFDAIDAKFRAYRDPALANHLPLYRLEDLLMRAESDIPLGNHYAMPLRTFMVVRNPWARMVSLYHHRFRKRHARYDGKPRNTPEDIAVVEAGFRPWLLTTPHAGDKVLTRMPQVDWAKDRTGRIEARFLRFERLTPDWLDMIEDWNLPPQSLSKVNRGKDYGDYRRFYDDATRAHVAHYFAPDIDLFRYAF